MAGEGISSFLTPEQLCKLGRLVFLSRYVVEGNLAGAHRSPRKGSSSEFADHKSYMQGDDPKHIDWKVFGRTDRYYVKRFQDETNLRVYLVVDRSASMAFGSGSITKYQYACQLAAAIGYVIVKVRDSVGLFMYSEKIDFRMDAANTFLHLNNLLKQMQSIRPSSKTEVAQSLHEVAEDVNRRALVVILSDLFDSPEAIGLALAHFRKQHHDVVVFHVLDPMEIDFSFRKGAQFEDMETLEHITVDPRSLAEDYQKVFGEFLERNRKMCATMNIDYRVCRTDTNMETFVRAYLEERRRCSK